MLALALAASIVAAGPVLEAPWACGLTYSCTQGNNGATSHSGKSQYAWDFGMPVGTEILAVRGGTVAMIKMSSNLGGCSQTYANDANYVLIDHGDDTAALYLHVEQNSTSLSVGDTVEPGDPVARVGLTGYTCGPHLHFQVQELCGSWWCQSIPAEFFAHGTIASGEQMVSENCGPCTATLDGGETTISESEVQCFDRLTKWWWDAGEGLDGHHWYTYASEEAQPATIGRWRFSVETPGDYEVEVHIPSANANTTGATYAIHHAGLIDYVEVNQSSDKGWQWLGIFEFDGGGDELLELPDNTGEAVASLIPLAFDSVRFTYVSGGDGDGDGDGDPSGDGDGDPGGEGGDGDGDCPVGQAGCMCTAGGGCDPGAVCVQGWCTPDGSGMGEDDEGGTGGDDPFGDDDLGTRGEDGGCACASGPSPGGAGSLGFGLLGLLWVTRRRGARG
ncbi:MAG: peptidoglycan DD-metalloendopeptidase family protein [Enhygromyxa sp.]